MDKKPLLTIKEAAAYAKMSISRLYTKLAAGEITAFKREGQTLVDPASIDAFNERHLKPWVPEKQRRGATKRTPRPKP